MNMFEEAKSLAVMMKMRALSQSETAKMLGVSQSFVANKLRLLNLSDEMQQIVLTNRLSERHARAILRLKKDEERLRALKIICERHLTVAESEALVDLIRSEDMLPKSKNPSRELQVNSFIDRVKESVNRLSSQGIYSTQKTSYYGKKIMITICIDQE